MSSLCSAIFSRRYACFFSSAATVADERSIPSTTRWRRWSRSRMRGSSAARRSSNPWITTSSACSGNSNSRSVGTPPPPPGGIPNPPPPPPAPAVDRGTRPSVQRAPHALPSPAAQGSQLAREHVLLPQQRIFLRPVGERRHPVQFAESFLDPALLEHPEGA